MLSVLVAAVAAAACNKAADTTARTPAAAKAEKAEAAKAPAAAGEAAPQAGTKEAEVKPSQEAPEGKAAENAEGQKAAEASGAEGAAGTPAADGTGQEKPGENPAEGTPDGQPAAGAPAGAAAAGAPDPDAAKAPSILDPDPVPDFKHLSIEEARKRIGRYAQIQISWNRSLLTDQQMQMVRKLVQAARVMDNLFWMQSTPDGLQWIEKLSAHKTPLYRTLLRLLMLNYGAYDRLANNEPFVGETPKPEGANYYPVDMTKEEFEKWLKAHPGDADAFKSNFTVIRRGPDKGLVAVPYAKEYERELHAASSLLDQAAELSDSPSLARYLRSRAKAFQTNDYFESDVDWVDVDSTVEVTIGPYEVYEDALFGYKAAFEAFITVKDPVESAKLKTFEAQLDRMEKALPIPDEHKNFKRGASSPMLVVDVIFTSGDTRAGVQTIAFNLPNDEKVREQKGSKKVMLRNVMAAKFRQILTPIAKLVLNEPSVVELHAQAFSNHTLLHEISHGLGPGTIKVDGKETSVNLALKELYPHLEEAKADILGLFFALMFADEGLVVLDAGDQDKSVSDKLTPQAARAATLTTFLAGIFRSTRFGTEEAHGKANLLIFNYLVEKGAMAYDDAGRVQWVPDKTQEAITAFAHDVLMIQALGDYAACKAFIAKYGTVSEPMDKLLKSLTEIPVDIDPLYDIP
jgi:hypothetical protein